MTKKEKRAFIRALIKSISSEALAKVDKMPENWDGIELRQYLADKFTGSIFRPFNSSAERYQHNRRMREYRNTVYMENL